MSVRRQELQVQLVLVLILQLIFPGASAFAGTPPGIVGMVKAVQGGVRLNGVAAPAYTTVLAGDRLQTGTDGAVVVGLQSGGRIALEGSTEVRLERSRRGVEVRLKQGRVVVQPVVGHRVVVYTKDSQVQIAAREGLPALCAVTVAGEVSGVECAQGEARVLASNTSPLVVPAGYRAVSPPSAAQASGQRAGSVHGLVPKSHIERGTTEIKTQVNLAVLWQDLVWTEKKGRVRLGLDDGSVLMVGSESRLRVVLHEVALRQTELEMKVGRLRAQVAKLGAQGKFEIRTSTAVLGVIGTDFYVLATPTHTQVVVFEGVVQVSSIAGVGASVSVVAGQQITVAAGAAPAAVTTATSAAIQAATAATQVGIGAGAVGAVSAVWVVVPILAGATAAAVPALINTFDNDVPASPSVP